MLLVKVSMQGILVFCNYVVHLSVDSNNKCCYDKK